MIGFYDGTDYSCFKDLDAFFDEVLREKYSGWRIFAHFGGRFDIHYLFDYIRAKMPHTVFDFYCAGSAVISFTITQGNHWWKFTDSYRLMPASLKKLTHEFDVKHKKMDADFTSWEYNRHDCIGLYEVLTMLFDAHQGVCSETIASHAMRVFRSQYQQRSIMIPPLDIEEDVRACYFGGRTEVFRNDSATVNHYDINSLYPSAMQGPLPTEYMCRTRQLPDNDDKIGFYLADVDLPEVYVPPLPYRLEKLYFPVGNIKDGHFTSMELRQAIRDGASVNIKSGILFLAEPILAEFVSDIHAMKQKAARAGDAATKYICKLLLNSLYGKWGQNRIRKAYCFDSGETHHISGAPLWPLENAPGIAWYQVNSMASHIMPHISAAIVARARLTTLGHLRAPAQSGGRIWYTDTDSLFTDVKIPTGDNIGQMVYEGKGVFRAYGVKEYRFKRKYKIKGLSLIKTDPRTGKKTEDMDIARRYLNDEIITQERMAGFMESVRKGLPTVRRVKVTRQMRHPRPKRASDGADTRPWNIKELTE